MWTWVLQPCRGQLTIVSPGLHWVPTYTHHTSTHRVWVSTHTCTSTHTETRLIFLSFKTKVSSSCCSSSPHFWLRLHPFTCSEILKKNTFNSLMFSLCNQQKSKWQTSQAASIIHADTLRSPSSFCMLSEVTPKVSPTLLYLLYLSRQKEKPDLYCGGYLE